MAAPVGNKNALGNNGGNPGYGQMVFIKEQVERYSKLWWTEWESMMTNGRAEDRRFAMAEFNKLQVKMIPQDLTSGGEKIESAPIYGGKSNN